MINHSRPININPFSIRLTIMAFVSGMHRISGFGVFLFIPLMLWLLETSLISSAQFNVVIKLMHQPIVGLGVALFLAGLLYHIIAGIRHLFFDIHIGDSARGGRIGAYLVLFVSGVLVVGMFVWIWG